MDTVVFGHRCSHLALSGHLQLVFLFGAGILRKSLLGRISVATLRRNFGFAGDFRTHHTTVH